MPFPIPSLEATRRYLTSLGRALFPKLAFSSRRSYHGKRATFAAGVVTQLHSHVDSAQSDLHPLTAGEGKPITDWLAATGVKRKEATPARKDSAGRVRGTPGTPVNAGDQMVHPETGLLFEIANSDVIPVGGFIDMNIAGISVGTTTRLQAGQVLKFIAPPPTLETDVVLQLDLDEDGFDREQFGAIRARFLSSFGDPQSGGNQSDFVRWAIESVPAIRTAYAYPNRAGKGTMDVAAFYAAGGASRSISSQDRATMIAYIKTKAPFQIAGEGGGLRGLVTIPDPQRVEIRLTSDGSEASRFDWDDSGGPEVASWDGPTRELQFDGPLPLSLQAGHRLLLDGALQDGSEFVIESVSGADTVILREAPPNAPVAGDLIYSGGPLVAPVRDAIVAHLNGELIYGGRGPTPLPESQTTENDAARSVIGLDVIVDGVGSANPGGRYNGTNGPSWSGGIVRAQLFKIATFRRGVMNATIITPATDYEAVDDEFPLDDQIHYVTPSQVIVRSA